MTKVIKLTDVEKRKRIAEIKRILEEIRSNPNMKKEIRKLLLT